MILVVNWNYIMHKLFILDMNTWHHKTVYKLIIIISGEFFTPAFAHGLSLESLQVSRTLLSRI